MNKRQGSMLISVAIMAAAMQMGGCNKSPPLPSMLPVASQASTNVTDLDVTEHVKTVLHQNESLKPFNIDVVTLKGDVRLMGVLDNQAQIDQAISIARAAEGAHTVHDELTIKKQGPL